MKYKISMRLGMNRQLETQVMIIICLAKWISDSDLRFTDIAQITQIPKPTLQRIMPRLVQRGWIKKDPERWINIPPNTMGSPLIYQSKRTVRGYTGKKRILQLDYIAREEFRRAENRLHRKLSSQERKRIALEVKAAYTPKKITVFKFLDFPYLTGVRNMPPGTKRLWKSARKVVIDYVKEHKIKPRGFKTT